MKCDVIASGIVNAVKGVDVSVPLVMFCVVKIQNFMSILGFRVRT